MPDAAVELKDVQATASSWHISENRPLAPFAQETHALNKTAFTPFVDGEPRSDQSEYYISEELDLGEFRPKFTINVDVGRISETTKFDPNELVLSITARGHGTKNYRHIRTWKLSEVPERFECSADDIRGLSPLQRITFCLIVSIRNELKREFLKPHYKASVLAERKFIVTKEPESPSFPTQTRPPEFFESRGLPRDSLWLVEFNGDPQAVTAEAITIYINEIAVKKLNKAFSGNVAGGLLRNQLAGEIFFDACQQILAAGGDDPADNESVLKQIRGCFAKFKLSDHQLSQMTKEAGASRLRCYVQSHLSLARKIESADLRRPWQR